MYRRKNLVEIALWLSVLGLALFLRVRHLDTTGFWGDQSFTLNTAMRWVNGGAMPLAANKSSAGFMNPPMIEYLYAAALALWPDVLSVALLTMVSGLAAVAAAGWSTYRVFGRRAAAWTALLFAVNPWSVYYSQLIWNQTMVPVFSSLMLACLLLYFAVEQRPAYLILSFAWATCMTQVHPGTAVQLVTMSLLCVLCWRKLRAWPLVVGIAVFVLLYVPFLLYERGVDWSDVDVILELARQPAPFSAAAFLVSLDLVRAQGLLRSAPYVLQFDGLATALLVLSLAGVLWATVRAFARRRRDPLAARRATGLGILLLWFALPILFYLRPSHYLQVYYLIGQLPAHFILIGAALDGAQRAVERLATGVKLPHRLLQVTAWALLPLPLLALVAWQCVFSLQFQDHRLAQRDGPMQLRHVRTVIQTSRRLLFERPACDLVAVSEGHSLEMSQLSLLHEFVSQERTLLADGRLALPLPAPCAVYLDALPGSRASARLVAATPLPDATLQVLEEVWRFYDVPASARKRLGADVAAEAHLARWANGVALARSARGPLLPGTTLPLTLTWSVEAQPPEVIYHIGAYLLSADGQLVAQSDGPGFDSIQWRAGDQFITWFDLPVPQQLPPGDYQLAVALYTWPALERVDLATGGNAAFLERLWAPEE